jgi:ribosomal protein L11 methyltransferase
MRSDGGSVPALDLRFPPTPALADRISTALHDLGPAAVHELGPDEAPLWRVFFTSHSSRDVASRMLAETLGGDGVQVSVAMVEDEDWARRSQADLPRVRVGRLIVAPPWDVPVNPAPGETVIRITPSMGFGTGHHETTRLCLGLLQRVDCRGLRVIDAGTGSGVLAIAAALLGARHVTAFDVDADAVACARDNVRVNFPGPESSKVHVRIAALGDDRPAGDIVLANLTGTTLVRGAASLLAQTAPGGRLILSGLLAHEQDTVLAAFQHAAVTELVEGEGEWRAVLLRRS